MGNTERVLVETTLQKVYVLKGITHLPHYERRNAYVSPGYGRKHRETLTSEQLVARGATPEMMPLWSRVGSRP